MGRTPTTVPGPTARPGAHPWWRPTRLPTSFRAETFGPKKLSSSFDIYICAQQTGEFNFPFISSHDLSDGREITCQKLAPGDQAERWGIRGARWLGRALERLPVEIP